MIHKTVTLRCSIGRAFRLFTEHAGEWWPEDRRHTRDAASGIVLEPAPGGRFYERARDGREVELGVVRVFEPDERLVLDWYPGTGPAAPTQVEVRFEPVREGTRVIVLHTEGPAGEELYRRRVEAYDRSWDLVLGALSRAAGEGGGA